MFSLGFFDIFVFFLVFVRGGSGYVSRVFSVRLFVFFTGRVIWLFLTGSVSCSTAIASIFWLR